jgi:hypothetical protein
MAKDHSIQVSRLEGHHEGRQLHPAYKLSQKHRQAAFEHRVLHREATTGKPFDRKKTWGAVSGSRAAYEASDKYNKETRAAHSLGGPSIKKSMWPDSRVTQWADQFMGTKLYGEALHCVMDGIKLCRDRDSLWKREDRMGNDIKARMKWERDNVALRKKEDALRSKKKDLEEKLVASRIEEEKHRSR